MRKLIFLGLLGGVLSAAAQAATITVDSASDDGTGCTLREAVQSANSNTAFGGCTAGDAAPDTINFNLPLPATITLGGNDLGITDDLIINGPGASQLTISGNDASRIFNIGLNAPSTLSGLTLTGGNGGGGDGGAVFTDSDLAIDACVITGNTAAPFGGGVRGFNTSVGLSNSTVSGNSATSVGGGLHVGLGGLTVINSTISGNFAEDFGGGIQGNTTLVNSTVSGNSAGISGGGIRVVNSLTAINSTIAFNNGGGIVSTSSDAATNFTASNSLIAQSAPGGACGVTIDSGSNNLVTDASCGLAGVSLTTVEALRLGALADNGGPTPTHALLPGSSAIDAGSNAVCFTDPVNGLDQRGASRLKDGNGNGTVFCDVGAYEHDPAEPSLNCSAIPLPNCAPLNTASLKIKGGDKPRLDFKGSGNTLSQPLLFGDPTDATGNLLCLYQDGELVQQYAVPALAALWKLKADGKTQYKDKLAAADGVQKIQQVPGAKGKLQWKIGGAGAGLPALPLSLPLSVQNQTTDGGCVGVGFTDSHIRKNEADKAQLQKK